MIVMGEACHSTTKVLIILALILAVVSSQRCKLSRYVSFSSGSHLIKSPFHPGLYPPSTTCFFYYFTDPGYRLTIDCYDVEMGSVPWDCSDSLSFVGSLEDDKINFCSLVNVQSADHRIMMILKSTESSNGGRFTCSVRAIPREPCDCGWSSPKRIVGGREAGVNEFPFMVSIINARAKQHYCGGAIISPTYVITAAHCILLLEVPYTGLLVGEHNMSTGAETTATRLHRAAQFIVHPDYNGTWNDIGLIRSATPFGYSMRVGPICLPFNRPYMPEVGDLVTAMGWGTTSFGGPMSDVLLKVKLSVVPQSDCIAAFNQSATSGKQFCTYWKGKDTCQMDSGGPLAIHDARSARMFLGGIVSFGADCAGDEPAVSTKVAPYADWIQQVTKENFCIK